MVFEPLWTLIPSNKAILPVLWSAVSEPPLPARDRPSSSTDELRETGYVSKPIVGRCGANISIFDQSRGAHRRNRRPIRRPRPDLPGTLPARRWASLYVQPSTFTVAGTYAGSGVRVDESLVITAESDNVALRVVDDDRFRELARLR